MLDASGRVRTTYADIETHRGNLVRLRTAVKDYSPLTVHLWQTSGSKSGFEKNGAMLIQGIVDAIAAKPDEPWLIVTHKPSGKLRTVETAIRRALPEGVGSKVDVISWGHHMATNAYAATPNVILAGTLFMRDWSYTALTHLAQDRDVAPGLVDQADVDRTMRGEHANLVLQALCRGRVRKSDGARCHPMTAYVIASTVSGIPEDLATIFPGCHVVPWRTGVKPLTGRLKVAIDFVEDALRRGETWIPLADVRDAVGCDKANFRRSITKGPEWFEQLARLGLEEVAAGPRGAKGLRRAPP